MKYEFRVGDYVETKDGQIGHIIALENLFIGWGITVQFPTQIKDFIATEVAISVGFKRIGRYNFVKSESKRIERLPINLVARFEISDGRYITTKTWNDKGEFVEASYSRELIDKINELVEAVNRLEEKVNE